MPVPIFPMTNLYNEPAKSIAEPGDYIGIDWSAVEGIAPEKSGASSDEIKVADSDAAFLLRFWKGCKGDGDNIATKAEGFTNSDILRLKALGFISGETESLRFTPRARDVIKNIILASDNNFSSERVEKPYTEILAEADKRSKQGVRLALGK